MTALVLALPWLAVYLFVRFFVRVPTPLATDPPPPAGGWPHVTVIVPARNEARNIRTCVESLVSSDYPSFDVVVVDDRSEDETRAIASSLDPGRARHLRVIEGAELPAGWLGKPWACRQGAAGAEGEILLFTDADTIHGPGLLRRSVAGLFEERADLLTVIGRQLMETFWERLLQPHVFLMMVFRIPDFERAARNPRWRDAIANGQFLLFARAFYEGFGGHEAVCDEVVEDLALAQLVKRTGGRLRIRSAEDELATRMYRSLPDLVEGWSKNLYTGGLQSFPHFFRPLAMPLALVGGVVLWLLPPVVLAVSGVGLIAAVLPDPPITWAGYGWSTLLAASGLAVAASAATYAYFSGRMGAPRVYGLLYPLGAVVTLGVVVRSWVRGERVEWKGRRYALPATSKRA